MRLRRAEPRTRPDGCVIVLIARGMSVQKAVWYDRGDDEAVGGSSSDKLFCGHSRTYKSLPALIDLP